MLRFEGDRRFPLPPAEAFAKLTDARFLVPCVPDVDAVKTLEPDRAEIVLRPSFAFVTGTIDITMRILDAVAPSSARVELLGKGIGSTSEIHATLAFAPDGDGTAVHWTAEVKRLTGVLKLIPSGLVRGAAESVITDAWDRVEAALKAPAG
jgi:carbon monoxide dehydrogenase subunit G